jgi:predicted SAM-dependent methyltransferase
MKINIGGGLKRFDGFLNVDADTLSNPDFVVDLNKDLLPFDDNTIEEIKAHHILEHIGDGFLSLMQEIYRVCKDGAIIDIEVPHHRHENYFGDPTHVRPITVEMLKKFSKKYNQWHIDTYGSFSGFGMTLNVDFEILEFDYIIENEYRYLVDQGKFDEIQAISHRFNNVYSDTKIKLIVVKDGE